MLYNHKICISPLEGLKKSAYKYRNFKEFRSRIFHMFSHENTNINK